MSKDKYKKETSPEKPCPNCGGTGWVLTKVRGGISKRERCTVCSGKGYIE